MKRNANMTRLSTNYLFPEINMRKKEFLAKYPEASLISLGIGDTTQPIPDSIVDSFVSSSVALGTLGKYSGYGPEQGSEVFARKNSRKTLSPSGKARRSVCFRWSQMRSRQVASTLRK